MFAVVDWAVKDRMVRVWRDQLYGSVTPGTNPVLRLSPNDALELAKNLIETVRSHCDLRGKSHEHHLPGHRRRASK